MSKYWIGGAVVAAALALTPFYVASRTDAKLNEMQTLLQQRGFSSQILSKSGYLVGTRTFRLEVVDAQKVRDFLLDAFVAKNPQYQPFAQEFKTESDEDIRAAFDGLAFNGQIVSSQALPADVKVSLALSKLPTSIEEELKKEEKSAKVVLPLIEKGVLAFDMTFDSRQNIKSVKMKDIKERLAFDEGTLDIDTQGQTLSLNERSNVLHGIFGIQKQYLSVTSPELTLQSQLDNLLYTFDYKDDLNAKGDLSLGGYRFSAKDTTSSDVSFSLGSMKITSAGEELNKQWNVKADYTLNNISLVAQNDEVKVDQLTLMLAFKEFESATLKKLQTDYNAIVMQKTTDEQALIDDFVALVRHGLKIELNVGLKNMSGTLALKDIGLNTTLSIAKNDFNDQQSPLAVLALIDVNAKLKLHKDDRTTLEALNLTAPSDFALGQAEGDFYLYDIAFKKGVLSVNGQVIQ